MKKILSILMALVFTMSMITGCSAAENAAEDFVLTMQVGNPMMTVNGAESEIDPGRGAVPVVQNGRTLVPIRAIIEAMGGTVNWNDETQTVLLEYNSDIITLNIGNTAAYLNETMHTLDVAPTTINDRTMLPIRFIAESFKFNVDWTEETQTITITKPAASTTTPITEPTTGGKTLVVYYSASGNTERAANYVAAAASADVFKLELAKPYTDADLNYNNSNSRVVYEHEHPEAQDVELVSTTVPNWDEYDTVFIGYPIWWGIAAWPVDNFVKENDFTGKTVIPFCTSASSGLGQSGELLADMAGTGDWQTGMRFRSGASESDVFDWVNSLQ